MKMYRNKPYLLLVLLSLTQNLGTGCVDKKNSSSGSTAGDNKFGSQGDLDEVSRSDSPLVDKFLHLLAQISNRAADLNREKDRRGKLRLALGANLGAGCMQDVPVKTLEVIVDGEKLGDLDVTKAFEGKDAPPRATGTSLFEISFGNTEWNEVLTFANDETKNTLFTVGARKSFVPTQSTFTIGKIQRIRIKKVQGAYEVVDLCEDATFTSSCKNRRKVKELERYALSSLKIKVNGELIYAKGNIAHTFANHKSEQEATDRAGLVWADDHAEINESYVKMKQREDCTALQ